MVPKVKNVTLVKSRLYFFKPNMKIITDEICEHHHMERLLVHER